jgi:hypothetical protein
VFGEDRSYACGLLLGHLLAPACEHDNPVWPERTVQVTQERSTGPVRAIEGEHKHIEPSPLERFERAPTLWLNDNRCVDARNRTNDGSRRGIIVDHEYEQTGRRATARSPRSEVIGERHAGVKLRECRRPIKPSRRGNGGASGAHASDAVPSACGLDAMRASGTHFDHLPHVDAIWSVDNNISLCEAAT